MRSVVVVLPASMCAMMPMLRTADSDATAPAAPPGPPLVLAAVDDCDGDGFDDRHLHRCHGCHSSTAAARRTRSMPPAASVVLIYALGMSGPAVAVAAAEGSGSVSAHSSTVACVAVAAAGRPVSFRLSRPGDDAGAPSLEGVCTAVPPLLLSTPSARAALL
jgi:hypothetical protein